MIRWVWLVTYGFLTCIIAFWLGVMLNLPVSWLIAIGLTQVGIMWWRIPWSIGVGIAALGLSWYFSMPAGILGYIGFLLQGWIPTWFFKRRALPFDIFRETSLSAFLAVGVLLNSFVSTLFLLPVWTRFQTFHEMSFSFALLWLLHSMVALVVVLPILRFGTHFLPIRGLWGSIAARQRSIDKPRIRRNDIIMLILMETLIFVLSQAFHQSFDVPVLITNVLFLLPTVILMTQRGFDGAVLSAAAGFVVAVATSIHIRQIDPNLQTFNDRIIFASITFEMGIYYLISIVVGLLIDAQRSERSRLSILLNLNRSFSNASDPNAALERLAEAISEALSGADCIIFTYERDTDMLKPLIATSHQRERILEQALDLSHFPTLKEPLTYNKTTILHSSQLQVPADISFFWLQTGYVAALLVPLAGVQHPLGLIGVFDSRAERIFAPAEIRLVEVMCAHAAIAFEQQHFIAQLQTQTTQLSAVAEITTTLNESLDLQHVCARIIEQIARVVPHDWAAVLLLNNETSPTYLQLITETAWQHQPILTNYTEPLTIQPYRNDLQDSQPTPKLLKESNHAWEHYLADHSLEIALHVPLMREQECLGMLMLASIDRGAFAGIDQHVLMLLTRHMALAISNASLYVELREAYIAQEQTQDMLLRTERFRALGELSSGIAHDFNNLLTAILGHTQLLILESSLSLEGRETLAVIEHAVRDGHQMIQRIQQFASPKANLVEELDIHSIVKDVVALIRPRWQNKSHMSVQLELQPVPRYLGSGYELRQVLTNLILNALDAMPQGGSLSIRVFQEQDEILLEVQDTGIGMDEQTIAQIWTPFFSTKGHYGTGLGMPMIHRIVVQQYGGRIDVESAPHEGCLIRLHLPYQADTQNRPELTPLEANQKNLGRLLVIEHDELVRSTIVRFLRLCGHDVTEVASGNAALPLLKAQAYHGVIADATITDTNIWHVLEQARQASPQAAIILLNAWLHAPELEYRHSLVDAVLPKPFEFQQLQKTLDQLLAVQGIT